MTTSASFANRMEENRGILGALIVACQGKDIRARAPGDDLSLLEQVCHLRDLERNGFQPRIASMLTEKSPQLFDFDGSAVARASNYAAQNIDDALADFQEARARNVAVVRAAPSDALWREGYYEPGKPVSLSDVLNGILEHDADHIRRIRALSAYLSGDAVTQ